MSCQVSRIRGSNKLQSLGKSDTRGGALWQVAIPSAGRHASSKLLAPYFGCCFCCRGGGLCPAPQPSERIDAPGRQWSARCRAGEARHQNAAGPGEGHKVKSRKRKRRRISIYRATFGGNVILPPTPVFSRLRRAPAILLAAVHSALSLPSQQHNPRSPAFTDINCGIILRVVTPHEIYAQQLTVII